MHRRNGSSEWKNRNGFVSFVKNMYSTIRTVLSLHIKHIPMHLFAVIDKFLPMGLIHVFCHDRKLPVEKAQTDLSPLFHMRRTPGVEAMAHYERIASSTRDKALVCMLPTPGRWIGTNSVPFWLHSLRSRITSYINLNNSVSPSLLMYDIAGEWYLGHLVSQSTAPEESTDPTDFLTQLWKRWYSALQPLSLEFSVRIPAVPQVRLIKPPDRVLTVQWLHNQTIVPSSGTRPLPPTTEGSGDAFCFCGRVEPYRSDITEFDAEACWPLNGPLFSPHNPLYHHCIFLWR